MSERIKCNIQKQEECAEDADETDGLQTWVLHAFEGGDGDTCWITQDVPRVPAQETPHVYTSAAQNRHQRHEHPADPVSELSTDDLLHEEKRDDAEQQPGKGEPDQHHDIVPNRQILPAAGEVLEIGQDIRRVRKEDQPEKCGDGDHHIDPFSLKRYCGCEVGDQEGNPCQKKIPEQKAVPQNSGVLQSYAPDDDGKDGCTCQQKEHHQAVFVV